MALEKITQRTGTAAYVPGNDIDTDQIIPALYMKCVTFDDLGQYLFYDLRKNEDGSDKEHPLNDPKVAGATILVSGANFGCGSSREHAPQAIYRFGFRGIIAESFADIFFGNCTTLGIPCARASREEIRKLTAAVDADPTTEVKIDVEGCQVTCGDLSFAVVIPDAARNALINGRWDPIGELKEGAAEVAERVKALGYA